MHTKETINQALELYIQNIPLCKICNQLHISKNIAHHWKRKYNWNKLREDAIQKQAVNSTEKIIQDQQLITSLANRELLRRLKEEPEDIKSVELVNIMKHGLEVVRPKSPNQVNFTQNENKVIQVNIPKEVMELINIEKEEK